MRKPTAIPGISDDGRLRVYVAGAAYNVTALKAVADYIDTELNGDVQLLTHWMSNPNQDWRVTFCEDISRVLYSDMLVAIHPYGEHGGTITEMAVAMSHGIPVIYVAYFDELDLSELPYPAAALTPMCLSEETTWDYVLNEVEEARKYVATSLSTAAYDGRSEAECIPVGVICRSVRDAIMCVKAYCDYRKRH